MSYASRDNHLKKEHKKSSKIQLYQYNVEGKVHVDYQDAQVSNLYLLNCHHIFQYTHIHIHVGMMYS